ncbi:hypothetical protein K474DRAFT_1603230 [Panus rudis PR-1116 ss-1]|nr:hypothetical protein K474DRAFT_1603230 [Panus rudis PR-1116 ss-1]
MVSLTASSSRSSLFSSPSPSQQLFNEPLPPPSPSRSISSGSVSSSSSNHSLNGQDEENVTITANRLKPLQKGKQKSNEDLRLLAVSTNITELSYSISDIQTRIFEIQELRHKTQSGDTSSASRVIDQSLAALDERLEAVSQGIKSVNESMESVVQSAKTPNPSQAQQGDSEETVLIRKHAAMLAEWESVQKESQVLREELKEDKWLTVFRTVTEQADGMMSSLEKAVNRCQDFMFRLQRHGPDDMLAPSSSHGSTRSEKSPLNYEVFTTLLDSFEAKKKHYMPATTKVLSIIDKGVQDRVTKNGECLRRHAECTQRWKNLKERIARTDTEMEKVRKLLLASEVAPSEGGSSASGSGSVSHNGFLATPPSESKSKTRGSSAASTISRSISPFRKLARKFKGSKGPAVTPVPLKKTPSRTPSSEPVPTLRHRASLFNLMGGGAPPTPTTPDRPSHKYSHSLTPDSSPSSRRIEALSTGSVSRPAWNSSTRVEDDERARTVKPSTPRRPSVIRRSEDVPPVPGASPYKRSVSRSSMASSRPWSPVTSSVSTAYSSNAHLPLFRPPSRTQTPGLPLTPRTRPKTPSHIPAPSKHWRSLSGSPSDNWDDDMDGMTTMMQRAFSPTRSHTPSSHPPRPPSRSMIPVPSVQISSASRPGSAMSQYRPDSSMSFRSPSVMRELSGDMSAMRTTPRPTLSGARLPPSSYKDSSAPRTPTSRPPSRTGASTPSESNAGRPLHLYVPANSKDPLDAEVAKVVNNIPHALLIERVDPPLRTIPKEGEEVRAQYAVSNALSRKVITCKLTTLSRGGSRGTSTKKVMCRVGGGWQDLHLYILNRQAGI